MKSVEDFTEFEQRGAYFDGDPVVATKKGVNILERGSQVHFMAEMQELFDLPPAPTLDKDEQKLVTAIVRAAKKLKPAPAPPRNLFWQRAMRGMSRPALLYRQHHAQSAARALLQAGDD